MSRLIINADDLGLTRGVNRAIFEAAEHGVATSATLMANASAFGDAVERLRTFQPYLDREFSVGCHVVLIDGQPVSPADQVRSLLGSTEPVSAFRQKLWKFAMAAPFGQISVEDVKRETSAQIKKLQSAGIEVSHVDCHKHTHMFPAVLEGVCQAATACGVTAIRNPFEPEFARTRRVKAASRVRASETKLLHALYAKRFHQTVARHGLATTEGSTGVTLTGTLEASSFTETIRALPEDGAYEFVCHPGYNDDDLRQANTRLLQSRDVELTILLDPQNRALMHSSGVKLMSYWELQQNPESSRSVRHPITEHSS